jgi:hypothetical protein
MPKQAKRTIQQLFQDFAAIMVELRQCGVIRSTNNPVSDYAEFLLCEALELKRAPGSTKGYDAKDKRGRRYEIKSRRLTVENPSRQLSAIRDMEREHFDFLAIVLFSSDFLVTHVSGAGRTGQGSGKVSQARERLDHSCA